MSLGIIGLAFASVPTFLLPSSGWSLTAELLAGGWSSAELDRFGWSLTDELLAYLAFALVVVVLLVPFVHLSEST